MGLLTDFYIANQDNYTDYGTGVDFSEEDVVQAKYLTPLELGGVLAALLDEEGKVMDLIDEFTLLTEEDAEDWISLIPKKMTDVLISMSNVEVQNAAERASQITKEELGWPAAEFETIITQLKALSMRAEKQNKQLYHWMGL